MLQTREYLILGWGRNCTDRVLGPRTCQKPRMSDPCFLATQGVEYLLNMGRILWVFGKSNVAFFYSYSWVEWVEYAGYRWSHLMWRRSKRLLLPQAREAAASRPVKAPIGHNRALGLRCRRESTKLPGNRPTKTEEPITPGGLPWAKLDFRSSKAFERIAGPFEADLE